MYRTCTTSSNRCSSGSCQVRVHSVRCLTKTRKSSLSGFSWIHWIVSFVWLVIIEVRLMDGRVNDMCEATWWYEYDE